MRAAEPIIPYPAAIETLTEALQAAFEDACGARPTRSVEVQRKWRQVAEHILRGTSEKADVRNLAVELHGVFIGAGHKTEIMNFPEDSSARQGWRGVARWVIARRQHGLSAPVTC